VILSLFLVESPEGEKVEMRADTHRNHLMTSSRRAGVRCLTANLLEDTEMFAKQMFRYEPAERSGGGLGWRNQTTISCH